MVRYAAENAIEDVELLKDFDLEGYSFMRRCRLKMNGFSYATMWANNSGCLKD